MTTNLPTDQDHGITIDKHEDGTGWTVSRYSDTRGQAYELQASILTDQELAALGDYDSEAGCFFATAYTQLNAQLIAGAILARLEDQDDIDRIDAQADAENAMADAADNLTKTYGHTLEDLIEILTSREG